MQIRKIKGLIVSERPFGETSKIIDIITSDNTLISVLSKGCKRLKSNLKAVSQRFVYANFIISYKENKLSTLIEGDVINSLSNIKKDILKISYLNFICELTRQVLKQSNNKLIYEIFINGILKINDGYDPFCITNIIELKYLDFLGVAPNLDGCVVCGNQNVLTLSSNKGGFLCKKHAENEFIVDKKTIKIIRMLKYVDISKITLINIKPEIKHEINTFLDDYYDRYTGLYLNSKQFLKSLTKL